MSVSTVIFTEEPSARIVIEELCKKLAIFDYVKVLEHEGKDDLERSIRRKIGAWRSPKPPRFIITRDLDSSQRLALTQHLLSLVPEFARARTKIRIIVPELESWYIGCPEALVAAGLITANQEQRIQHQSRFRDLCSLRNAKQEFYKLIGRRVGQIDTAHLLGPLLDPNNSKSANLKAVVAALRWATTDVMDGGEVEIEVKAH